MATLTKQDSAFEVAPAGTNRAACVAVIGPCTHDKLRDEMKDGKKTGRKVQVKVAEIYLAFELARKAKDGKPFLVGRAYTWSDNDLAHFPKVVEAVTGKPLRVGDSRDPHREFPLRPCLVSVKHIPGKSKQGKDRVYANLDTISPPMDGDPSFQPETAPITWEPGEEITQGMFEGLPRIFGQTVEEWISTSDEMAATADSQPEVRHGL